MHLEVPPKGSPLEVEGAVQSNGCGKGGPVQGKSFLVYSHFFDSNMSMVPPSGDVLLHFVALVRQRELSEKNKLIVYVDDVHWICTQKYQSLSDKQVKEPCVGLGFCCLNFCNRRP